MGWRSRALPQKVNWLKSITFTYFWSVLQKSKWLRTSLQKMLEEGRGKELAKKAAHLQHTE